MRLIRFDLEKDFDTIKNWITDERTHAMWCANYFKYPLEKENFAEVLEEKNTQYGDTAYIAGWLKSNDNEVNKKSMYNELFRRFPKFFENIDDINDFNKLVNYNTDELLKTSKSVQKNIKDIENRHKAWNIESFDTRESVLYDDTNDKAYKIDFSIANLKNGKKIAYAKKFAQASNDLLNKIKTDYRVETTQQSVLDNNISQNNDNVKFSINTKNGKLQENGKDVKLETSDTGNTGTLMAIHNLSEDKLKGILELGGFPVPSIAVTNPNLVDHKGYGNISVLFDKSTIDPANKNNEIYDRDVWSPKFPQTDREINSKNIDKVAPKIGMSNSSLQSLAEDYNNVEDLSYRLSRDADIVEKYLNDNKIKYDMLLSYHHNL